MMRGKLLDVCVSVLDTEVLIKGTEDKEFRFLSPPGDCNDKWLTKKRMRWPLLAQKP